MMKFSRFFIIFFCIILLCTPLCYGDLAFVPSTPDPIDYVIDVFEIIEYKKELKESAKENGLSVDEYINKIKSDGDYSERVELNKYLNFKENLITYGSIFILIVIFWCLILYIVISKIRSRKREDE